MAKCQVVVVMVMVIGSIAAFAIFALHVLPNMMPRLGLLYYVCLCSLSMFRSGIILVRILINLLITLIRLGLIFCFLFFLIPVSHSYSCAFLNLTIVPLLLLLLVLTVIPVLSLQAKDGLWSDFPLLLLCYC